MVDTNGDVYNYTEGNIKKEITFGNSWPRLIGARRNDLRNISAVVQHYVQNQMYEDVNMIKHMSDDDMIKTLINRINIPGRKIISIDASSFDSAQRGQIWCIDKAIIDRVLPHYT